MQTSYCHECGAAIKPGRGLCPACLLSVGAGTEPIHPISHGRAALPCVFGGYRLLKKIGAGGMGIVYEAEDLANGRRLALKVLGHSLDNGEQRKRFLREGRLAATIDHPNSVYVFGAEEIEGQPVIAMELATGGTLRDYVKLRGPLPVCEAVDLVLGIIDGLEAAQTRGILHRDMKPSNCFVTAEGKAMVGDFGLSISLNTAAADHEHLTRSGLILGTPAFSSPEQLRGQPLDVRADIYSTAGTLYYLLTGKAPVEADTAVETVSAVLEGRIKPLNELRPQVPEDLASTVMRCLSADMAKRPAFYTELRTALTPFNSIPPVPASLGARFLAGVVDWHLLQVGFMLMLAMVFTRETVRQSLIWFGISVGIYAVLESFWGATPGKWLADLRVARLDNSRPGLLAATIRASLFLGMPLAVEALVSRVQDRVTGGAIFWAEILSLLPAFSMILWFVPFINVKAGWHDRLTGLRVWRRSDLNEKRLTANNTLPVPSEPSETLWGPFQPGTLLSSRMRCGYDPMLHRPVLMSRRGSASPSLERRECRRSGRLRWMQSVRSPEGEMWDVWQAPAGAPLAVVLGAKRPSWGQMLRWQEDLAEELEAAGRDGTLPARLSLSQVWITVTGRAVLLDEAWAGENGPRDQTSDPQVFLHQLIEFVPSTQRPLHTDAFISSLQNKGFDSLHHVLGNLAHLKTQCLTVSKSRRAYSILAPVMFFLLPILLAVVYALSTQQTQVKLSSGYNLSFQMFGSEMQPNVFWNMPFPIRVGELPGETVTGIFMGRDQRVEKSAAPELEKGVPLKEPIIVNPEDPIEPKQAGKQAQSDEEAEQHRRMSRSFYAPQIKACIGVMTFLNHMSILAICQLLCILALGAPLLMKLTGISPVSAKRRPAGRARMSWRWFIGWTCFWSPWIVVKLLAAFTDWTPTLDLVIWLQWSAVPMAAVMLLPGRSVVDRLAGTWLAAR